MKSVEQQFLEQIKDHWSGSWDHWEAYPIMFDDWELWILDWKERRIIEEDLSVALFSTSPLVRSLAEQLAAERAKPQPYRIWKWICRHFWWGVGDLWIR